MKLLDILNEIKIIPPIITDWESIFKLVQTYNPNLSLKEIQHSLIAYRLLDQTDLPPDNPVWSWIIPSMDTPETNPEYSQGYMIKVFFDFDYGGLGKKLVSLKFMDIYYHEFNFYSF